MTLPLLLTAAALLLPAAWGWTVWWILDRLWPPSATGNGGPAASESNVLDFQI
jgi:hypothetical protein